MLLFFHDSLSSYFQAWKHNQANYDQSVEFIALMNILEARREGKIIVLGSETVLQSIIDIPFLLEIHKSICRNIKFHLTELMGLMSKIKFYVELIAPDHIDEKTDDNVIVLPIKHFHIMDRLTRPVLICENYNDCRFYECCGRYYAAHNQLQMISVSFNRCQGGGQNTVPVVKEFIERRKEFFLCIIDSDKCNPYACYSGPAKKISKMTASMNGKIFIISARYVENLFSFRQIQSSLRREIAFNERVERLGQIYNLDIGEYRYYLDIKKNGLTCHPERCHDEHLARWNTDFISKLKAANLLTCQHDTCTSDKNACNQKILNGFNDKLLAHCVDFLSTLSDEELQETIVGTKVDCLWREIGELVFAFGCHGHSIAS
ncbi:hypothetical protein [Desulfarculus baarsii]